MSQARTKYKTHHNLDFQKTKLIRKKRQWGICLPTSACVQPWKLVMLGYFNLLAGPDLRLGYLGYNIEGGAVMLTLFLSPSTVVYKKKGYNIGMPQF